MIKIFNHSIDIIKKGGIHNEKIQKNLGIFLSLATVMAMSTTAFAANDTEQIEPRGAYIRECVAYEPNYTTIDYTHKLLGSVSGDNTKGSSTLQITYSYEQSGTTTASIAGHVNGSTEANVVFAKMQVEVGVEVAGSRSWTKGTSAGVSYGIAPGKFEVLNVYIPAVRTAGRLKYKVYMDGYPENIFYEYKTLSESYAPQKNSVHYKVTSSSRSAIKVPQGMTVYTTTGVYKAQ